MRKNLQTKVYYQSGLAQCGCMLIVIRTSLFLSIKKDKNAGVKVSFAF